MNRTLNSSLRSRRQHKAWGVSPRKTAQRRVSPWNGRQHFQVGAVQQAVARFTRLGFTFCFALGLTPQALCYRLLRRLEFKVRFMNNPG
jgi:hypothetical protein